MRKPQRIFTLDWPVHVNGLGDVVKILSTEGPVVYHGYPTPIIGKLYFKHLPGQSTLMHYTKDGSFLPGEGPCLNDLHDADISNLAALEIEE